MHFASLMIDMICIWYKVLKLVACPWSSCPLRMRGVRMWPQGFHFQPSTYRCSNGFLSMCAAAHNIRHGENFTGGRNVMLHLALTGGVWRDIDLSCPFCLWICLPPNWCFAVCLDRLPRSSRITPTELTNSTPRYTKVFGSLNMVARSLML
jgi:hypothetical protein